jgi:hypothetical protein
VLRHRSLYESTNVTDGECQVRSCVGEVAKSSHKTPVLRSVHLLRRAVIDVDDLVITDTKDAEVAVFKEEMKATF